MKNKNIENAKSAENTKSTKENEMISLIPKMNNYREILEYAKKNYSNNIAYKYKKNPEEKPAKYVEKTYNETIKDVKALATALLKRGLANKRVALIGENRYEWLC